MKIVLKKSDFLDDWYVIERAHHEGRQWLERTGPNMMKLMDSARISDACLEGGGEQMLAIARAIKRVPLRRSSAAPSAWMEAAPTFTARETASERQRCH